MKNSMFLSNLSIVDHAYIDTNGLIVGGSFNPSFIISGEMDEVEQVVIDFSTCKKDVKAIIDDKEIGMDHKLWIGEFSNCEVQDDGVESFKISTPVWDITLPYNAVHFVNAPHYDTDSIGVHMQKFVQSELEKKYPTIKVEVINTVEAHGMPWMTNKAYFTYSHGLKNSTSWGCQNIAHGHLSYINIVAEDEIGATLLGQKIAAYLDRTMFVWEENLNPDTNTISYSTERGQFKLTQRSNDAKVCLFNTETTIENLTNAICDMFADDLNLIFASEVYISEGLSKGAVYYV